MEHDHYRKTHRRTSIILVIGVLVLIALLLLWLTVADMAGDTDVAAQVLDIAGRAQSALG